MEGNVDRCIKCGSCQRACPVLNHTTEESFPGPRTVAVDVPRGPTPSVLHDVLWNCSLCEACADACPSRVELPQALLSLRRRLFDPSHLSDGHSRMLSNIDGQGLSVAPSRPRKSIISDDADICYFPGCIAPERTPEAVDAAIGLIKATGGKVAMPPGLVCCGSPLRKIGDRSRADRCQRRNLELLSRYDRIVTSCPGCTNELVSEYGLDAVHLVEYLTEVGGKRLDLRSRGPQRLSLHAACHLERGVGVHTTEETWQLLNSLPDVTIVELDDASVCCGAGGGLRSGNPQIASTLALSKIRSAREAGTDVLVAACPFCVLNLQGRGEVEVQELGRLLWSHLAKPGQP